MWARPFANFRSMHKSSSLNQIFAFVHFSFGCACTQYSARANYYCGVFISVSFLFFDKNQSFKEMHLEKVLNSSFARIN